MRISDWSSDVCSSDLVQLYSTELAHAQDDHVLRFTAAPAGGRAELLAMTQVQPLIGLVDTGIGHVGEVTTGLDQIGLAVQVAPDDPYLLACALATQDAAQVVFGLGGLDGGANLRAHLAGSQVEVQFAAAYPLQQHRREIGRASCRERVCQYV